MTNYTGTTRSNRASITDSDELRDKLEGLIQEYEDLYFLFDIDEDGVYIYADEGNISVTEKETEDEFYTLLSEYIEEPLAILSVGFEYPNTEQLPIAWQVTIYPDGNYDIETFTNPYDDSITDEK